MNNLECRLQEKVTRIKFVEMDELKTFSGQLAAVDVFDTNTAGLFSPPHEAEGHAERRYAGKVILPPGEEHKTWQSMLRIIETGMKCGLGRDGFFRGIGGGVICDMTGLAASVYMRGSGLVLVPTTLLAMVDAALGGKTGVDYGGYKNIIGSFYPAEEVQICLDVLDYLPDREFLCGLAEVIKHALLSDKQLLNFMETNPREIISRNRDFLEELVERAVRVKITIVEKDFKETGLRELLNFGHTFGHALETVTSFAGWSHGEAVAWGMVKALETGVALSITPPEHLDRVRKLLQSYGYRTESDASPDELVAAMNQDKKKKGGEVRFVLQRSAGDTFITAVPLDMIRDVLSGENG